MNKLNIIVNVLIEGILISVFGLVAYEGVVFWGFDPMNNFLAEFGLFLAFFGIAWTAVSFILYCTRNPKRTVKSLDKLMLPLVWLDGYLMKDL